MPDMAEQRKKRTRGRRRTAKPRSTWGRKLYAIRERLDLTQEAAVAKLGVPVATWRNWEQGRTEPNAAAVRLLELTFPPTA